MRSGNSGYTESLRGRARSGSCSSAGTAERSPRRPSGVAVHPAWRPGRDDLAALPGAGPALLALGADGSQPHALRFKAYEAIALGQPIAAMLLDRESESTDTL